MRVSAETGERIAHYTGIQLCGSIHACPVCSPRIRQQRAVDLDAAAVIWLKMYGAGSLLLLTLTMPHDHGARRTDLLDTVRDSFGAMVSGRAWQADKKGFELAYYVVSHDCTVGPNGWHPHLHVLLFARAALDDGAVTALGARLYARWTRAVTRRGHRPPSPQNGLVLERARTRKDVARYVCQVVAGDGDDDEKSKPVALELARGDLKQSHHAGHRTPWQVLRELTDRRANAGQWTPADDRLDDRDLGLWREWEKGTKGLRAIRWAKGLRAAVGLEEEKSDEEIVAEEIGGIDVYQFHDVDSWRAVSSTPGGRGRVLAAAELHGPVAVRHAVDLELRRWRERRAHRIRDKAS